MKKYLAIIISLAMVFSLSVFAAAEEEPGAAVEASAAAETEVAVEDPVEVEESETAEDVPSAEEDPAENSEEDSAENGEEAIRMARENHYRIIFMDHMMPGMDGVECMHRIRALYTDHQEHARFVALTANVSSTAREMFLSEGFDAFLAKPVERMELKSVLKKVLRSG